MVLLISALLHDIGRKNNSNDIRHGEIGACKAKQLLKDKKIFDIIKNHSIGDRNIKSEHKEMILILKDADALERIRNNDLNVKYIRNKESLCFIDFAKSLFSELKG
jgi:HD superfamily phosphodiesterase